MSTDTIIQITLVYLVQLAELLSFIGFGYAFFKLLKLKLRCFRLTTLPLILASLGVVGITPIATALNFYFPINHLVAGFTFLTGIIIFIINKSLLSKVLKGSLIPILLLMALVYSISLVWGVQLADTFTYHILSSKWVAECPMPIGAANLNKRLGTNSLMFTTYALSEFLLFKLDKPFFSIFSIFIPLFLYSSRNLLKQAFKPSKKLSSSDYYIGSFIIIAAIYNRSFGSIAPDLSAIMFSWLTFYFTILMNEEPRYKNSLLKLVVLFASFTTTIKLSMAPIALLPIVLLAKHIIQNKNLKGLKTAIAFSFFIVSIFVVKGYIQSGYPAFPNQKFAIDVKWKYPEELAKKEEEFICNCTKDYVNYKNKDYMKNYKWVPRWFLSFLIYERGWNIAALLSLILIIVEYSNMKMDFNQKFIFVVSLIGIGFVMFTAPAARFAHTFLFTSFLIPLISIVTQKDKTEFFIRRFRKLPIAFLSLGIVLLICGTAFIYDNYFGLSLFNKKIIENFPATQLRSLPFVYGAFSISLAVATFVSFYLWKKSKKIFDGKNKGSLKILSARLFVGILLLGSLSHIVLEIPAIFAEHMRLKFPEREFVINSTKGITTYLYKSYICNNELLATDYKTDVYSVNINGRYYFMDGSKFR